ncbi:MAG: hypothetical protein COB12_11065 [Flavobacterium sp.]|nr:MAG: hypothetical protein COB12_11065 [Flavobacterium sp.]
MKDKKHTEGFNVPKDYFEEFEEHLFSKLSEGIFPKEPGFSVPNDYFNEVEEKIIITTKDLDKDKKVISMFSRKTLLYAASIAAIAILVFSLFNSNNSIISMEEIDISSIESYIEEERIEFSSQDLTALLNDEDFSVLTSENEFITEKSITEYLLENIEDTSIINE